MSVLERGGERRPRQRLNASLCPGRPRKCRFAFRKRTNRRVARPSGTTTGPGCSPLGMGERKLSRVSAGREDLKSADTGTLGNRLSLMKLQVSVTHVPVSSWLLSFIVRAGVRRR